MFGGMTEIGALIAAIAAAVATVIVAFRKRQDVDVDELLARNRDLEERVSVLETTVGELRSNLVQAEGDRFRLRLTLASHGISDPTLEAS